MSENKQTVLRCLICQTESVGTTLKDAMDKLHCTGELGPNPLHKAAFIAGSEPVYELNQKIEDDAKGTTDLSGNVKPTKEAKASKPPKDSKQEKPPKEESAGDNAKSKAESQEGT